MNRRGNVLLHVLITGVVVALVSAMILRMALLRYTIGARAHTESQNIRNDQGAANLAITTWNGSVCSVALPGYTCSGIGAGNCSGATWNSYMCRCYNTSNVDLRVYGCTNSGNTRPNCGQCQMGIDSGSGYSGNIPY